MGRAKLNMELIPKEKSRNSTFLKRKKGLKKKTFEFSTLCGVDACMIIYGPQQSDRPIEPETYPNNIDEVHRIIQRYRDISQDERGKRNLDLFYFFEDQNKKMDEELVKLRKKNDQLNFATWGDRIKDFKLEELKEFMVELDSRIEKIDSRRNDLMMKGKQQSVSGLIEYSNDTLNQNHLFQSCTTFDMVQQQLQEQHQQQQQPICWLRNNDIIHQQPHQLMMNMNMVDYYSSDLIFDNGGPSIPLTMNNGYINNLDNIYSGQVAGNYSSMTTSTSYPMMVKTPGYVYEHHQTVRTMPCDDIIDVANLGKVGPSYYPVYPDVNYRQLMMPGSSSSTTQMMHHQPLMNGVSDLQQDTTFKCKRSRFN